ncbi:hypothetical protein FACS1894166_01710 [Bacilli bacterium]|nr:hypothetical protein FACS1894166_01710 [Bacilli bacterium]
MDKINTKKIEIGQTKEQHLDSLQSKLTEYLNQIKLNNEQINDLEDRLNKIDVHSKQTYKMIRKYIRAMAKLIFKDNRLQGLASAIQYSIKRNELASEAKMDHLTAEQLFEYIRYIEDYSDGASIPFNLRVVNRINMSTRR